MVLAEATSAVRRILRQPRQAPLRFAGHPAGAFKAAVPAQYEAKGAGRHRAVLAREAAIVEA